MPPILIFHIAACSLGYLCFAAAFAVACMYLHRDRSLKTKRVRLDGGRAWSLDKLDHALFLALVVGLVFLGVGLPTGVMVQQRMYGAADFASVRLLFPFTIWVFYLLIFLFRQLTGLRGRVPAYLSVLGFNCSVFSFLFEMYLTAGS